MHPSRTYPRQFFYATTRPRGYRGGTVFCALCIGLVVGALIATVSLAYLMARGREPFAATTDSADMQAALELPSAPPTPQPVATPPLI